MSTTMHFRKRQLFEYQAETQSSYSNNQEQAHSIGPMPHCTNELQAASLNSEKSTPTKYGNTPSGPGAIYISNYATEQMQILAKIAVAILEMEIVSPTTLQGAQTVKQIAEVIAGLENISGDTNCSSIGGAETYDASTLFFFAYNLKQSIEQYIQEEISNSSANKVSLSSFILAKLNQLRVNVLLQQNQRMEQEKFEVPVDLSIKRKHDYESRVEDQLPKQDLDFEESTLAIDERFVEAPLGDDEVSGISENPSSKKSQLENRISRIFSFINRTKIQIEELSKQGVNVHEKGIKSVKNSFTNHTFKILPKNENSIPSPMEDNMFIIGANGTKIPKSKWESVDWNQSASVVTRKLLMILFGREILATHSLTGRPSPTFLKLNYSQKLPLDPKIVSDLVDLVTSRTTATAKQVRMAITTKCADVAKLRRSREIRKSKQNEILKIAE